MQEVSQLSIICSFCVEKKHQKPPHTHLSLISLQPALILSAQFAIKDFTSTSSLFVISELLILFVSAPAFGCCKVFTRKLEEVGRVLFLISLTQKIPTAHKQSHVSMLQEDLLRLPSFPRSAIDAEFSLFSDPQGIQTKASPLSGISRPCLVRG